MRTRSFTLSLHWIITVAVLIGAANIAHAQYSTWRGNLYPTGPYFDAFSNGDYWTTTNAPGAADVASFIGTGTQSLNGQTLSLVLDTSPSVLGFRSRYGSYTVNLDMAGSNLTTSSTTADYSQWDGGVAGTTLNLTNSGGSLSTFHWHYFLIGRSVDQAGHVTLTGPNLLMTSTSVSVIGSAGTGSMTLTGGAHFESAASTQLGNNAAGNGTLLVSGNGTEFRVGTAGSSHLTVGVSGTGSLTVQDQAYLYVRSNLRVGYLSSGTGTALVTGANTRADVNILNIGTYGALTLADGGHMDTRATTTASTVAGGGVLRLDNGTAAFTSHLTLDDGSITQFVIREERAVPFITLTRSDANLNIADGTALLDLSLDPDESLGLDDYIPLLTYGGTLTGEFSGYEDGHTFQLGDHVFEITYAGGVGNDTVGLTVIPEPGAIGLLMAAAGMLALTRRRTCKTR